MRKSYLFIIFYFLCAELPAANIAAEEDCYTRCGNFCAAVYNFWLGEEPAAGPAAGHTHRPTVAEIAAAAQGERNTMSSLYSDVAVPALPHGMPGAEEMSAEAVAGSTLGFRPDHPPSTGVGKAGASTLPTVASAGPGAMIYNEVAKAYPATLPTVASAGPGALVFNKASGVGFLAGGAEAALAPDTGRVAESLTMGDLAAASGGSATGSGFPYPGVQAHSSDGDIPTTAPGLPGTASDEPPPTGEGK